MRSNILELNEQGIKDVVEQQFEVAKQIIAKGLVQLSNQKLILMQKTKLKLKKY